MKTMRSIEPYNKNSLQETKMNGVLSTLKKIAIAAGLMTGLALAAPGAEAAPIGNASFGIGGAFSLPSGSNLGNTNSIFIANGGMIVVTAPDTMDLVGLVNL